MEEEVIGQGLTAVDWALAGAVFVLGIVLGQIIRRVLTRRVERSESEHYAALVVGRLVGAVFVLAGFVYGLSILEVRLGPLLGAIGIGGIAIALAAQSFVGDFLASVLLQLRRPFVRGDQVAIADDIEGRVEDINFRTVVLRGYDGERLHVPSGSVLSSPITNHTQLGRRRTTLQVGVAYATDLQKAQAVLLQAVQSVEGVRTVPRAEALVEQFGDSSIDFAVRYWHDPDILATWRIRSEVAIAVKAALDRAGITIPFPQRDVHFDPPPQANLR